MRFTVAYSSCHPYGESLPYTISANSRPAKSRASSLRRAMPPRNSVLARVILSGRNSGAVSTSLKTPSTSSVFSFKAENETLPVVSPMLLSTLAAMFSSCSSNCSPVFVLVPPVRITMPVMVARPALSAGSNKFPVRKRATPLITGNSWSSSR